jgi:hypothetical protein
MLSALLARGSSMIQRTYVTHPKLVPTFIEIPIRVLSGPSLTGSEIEETRAAVLSKNHALPFSRVFRFVNQADQLQHAYNTSMVQLQRYLFTRESK